MKSLIKGFKVLNFDELLLINGGYGGGSGGGGSSYSGGSGGSFSGCTTSWAGSSKSVTVSAGKSSSKTNSSVISGSYSGSSGGPGVTYAGFDSSSARSNASARGYSTGSGGVYYNTTKGSYNGTGYAGCSGGSTSCGEYGSSLTNRPAILTIGENGVADDFGDETGNLFASNLNHYFSKMTDAQKSLFFKKLEEYVKKDPGDYVLGTNDCDMYVQKALDACGMKIASFWGDAKYKTCDEHIAILGDQLNAKAKSGWNIVLMSDGKEYTKSDGSKGKANSHAALVYVGDNGVCTIYQQTASSKTCKTETFGSVTNMQNAYLYGTFGYISIGKPGK